MSVAEQRVKRLAKLPGNSVCANCGTSKKFGFSTVCIKFFTFVCNECKSSHQAISHRCKSLTMSSWTDAEVAELELKGNDYARRTWLKNAPPVGSNGRPKEGDHVDVFKRFVVDVYERRKYYGDDTTGVTPQEVVVTAMPIAPATFPMAAPTRPVHAPPPQPPPAPAVDLLDFGNVPSAPPSSGGEVHFDPFGVSTGPAPVNSIQPEFAVDQAPVTSSSAFAFMLPPPTSALPPVQVPPAPTIDTSGFSFISNPTPAFAPAPVEKTAKNVDFADFAGLSISSPAPAPVPQPPAARKPIMCPSGTSDKASLISSMDSLVAPSGNGFGAGMGFGRMGAGMNQGMGAGMNQGMGGMSNNINNGMHNQQRMMMMQQQHQGMMGLGGGTGMNMMTGGVAMVNNNMMMGGGAMNNNMMMGGGMMNQNMGGAMGTGMMTPQQMMMMMNQQNSAVANRSTSANTMNSLSLSGMDMNAWTTGKK